MNSENKMNATNSFLLPSLKRTDTFLTDISIARRSTNNSVKYAVPINYDHLILTKNPESSYPKPINPLFFIINGQREKDKQKLINFNTNPSLFKIRSKNNKGLSVKLAEDEIDHGIYDNFTHYKTFYNKKDNKTNELSDFKTLVFNERNRTFEDKINLIKVAIKKELKLRSMGGGIFQYLKSFEKRRKVSEFLKEENRKDLGEIVLNLREENQYEKSYGSLSEKQGEIWFKRNYVETGAGVMKWEDVNQKPHLKKLQNNLSFNQSSRLYKPVDKKEIIRRVSTTLMSRTNKDLQMAKIIKDNGLN